MSFLRSIVQIIYDFTPHTDFPDKTKKFQRYLSKPNMLTRVRYGIYDGHCYEHQYNDVRTYPNA